MSSNIPDILQEKGPGPVSISTLSESSKVDKDKLLQVLRYLANMHIFTEVSDGHFSNSRTSLLLLKEGTIRDFVSYVNFFSLKGSTKLTEVLLDPILGGSVRAKDSASAIAAEFKEKGVETIYQLVDRYHPSRASQFSRAMIGYGSDGLNGWLSGESTQRREGRNALTLLILSLTVIFLAHLFHDRILRSFADQIILGRNFVKAPKSSTSAVVKVRCFFPS